MRLRSLSVLVALVIILMSPIARADDEFRKHFEEGVTAYELGEFVRAAEAYKAAHRIRRDPALLYNIAQSYRLGGDLEKAVFFYKSYLRSTPKNHREVEDRVRTLEAQIVQQKTIVAQAPNALMDSKPVEVVAPPVVAITATPEHKPLVRKWWLWTAVGGAVVVGVALGVGLGLGLKDNGPNADHSFHLF